MTLKFGEKEYEIEEQKIVFTAIAVVCVIAYLFTGGKEEVSKELKVETISMQTPQVQRTESRQIRIYIKGGVKKPGIYYLEQGSLIIDAVNAAGGFSEKASKDFNMVWQLKDNCMINIPSKGEKGVGKICSYSLQQKKEKSKKRKNNKRETAKRVSQNTTVLININKASKADLMTLNGVGEVIAERIIDYRKSTRFVKPEDLKNVSGIGEKTFENMKDYICTK